MLKTPTSRSRRMAFSFMLMLILLLSACSAPAPSTSHSTTVVKGSTWIEDTIDDPSSLLPYTSTGLQYIIDQTLFAPLFYGDSQGSIHPGLVSELPTVANGEISADLKTWTFKLRPGLVWSDDQPLTAEDVDFSWRLWTNPKFPSSSPAGFTLITGADLSADKLSITFHLKAPFAPFISIWTDGFGGPLPKHLFAGVAPDKIVSTSDNLNPSITSGPFMMSESKPGDHYTLVRNPKYYRAAEGLPYLNKLILRVVPNLDAVLKDLQAGSITASYPMDVSKHAAYEALPNYHLAYALNSTTFEGIYFNFRNPILGKNLAVRKAMAMAIDRQALISTARRGLAVPLCANHSKGLHPGYQADAPCTPFDPVAANTLLEQNGWTKGSDGVRSKAGQRLEFTYSTYDPSAWRIATEEIIQANLQVIGIKLTIRNYPASTFFGTILPAGKPGQYDIAEFQDTYNYDADDEGFLGCDRFAPKGFNFTSYCNPALDNLFHQEQSTIDPAARQQIFNQIHQVYLTDFPFITLYEAFEIGVAKKTTHNYQPGPSEAVEMVNVWEWWCDGGHC